MSLKDCDSDVGQGDVDGKRVAGVDRGRQAIEETLASWLADTSPDRQLLHFTDLEPEEQELLRSQGFDPDPIMKCDPGS